MGFFPYFRYIRTISVPIIYNLYTKLTKSHSVAARLLLCVVSLSLQGIRSEDIKYESCMRQILCLLAPRAQTDRSPSFSGQTRKRTGEPGSTPIEDNAENEEIIPF